MSTAPHVIGVLGASGGLGASVLTCAIAVRAVAAGLTAVAVDGVRFGGGLDVTMGVEHEAGPRWPDLGRVRGEVDGRELLARLPGAEETPVLSFDRTRDADLPPGPVEGVVAGLCHACDLIAVDLPGPDSPLLRLLARTCTDLVLLVGTEARALAAACALAPQVTRLPPAPWLCIRAAGRDLELARVVATAVDLPFGALLRQETHLDADLSHGLAPGSERRGPVAAAADELLAQVVAGAGRQVA